MPDSKQQCLRHHDVQICTALPHREQIC